MLGLGFSEILVIFVIFLLIFGPDKLPKMAREAGKFINQARTAVDEFKGELTAGLDEDSEEQPSGKKKKQPQKKQEKAVSRGDSDEYDL